MSNRYEATDMSRAYERDTEEEFKRMHKVDCECEECIGLKCANCKYILKVKIGPGTWCTHCEHEDMDDEMREMVGREDYKCDLWEGK